MNQQSATIEELLLCGLLYAVMLYIAYKNRVENKRRQNIILIIGIVLLCLFSFWGSDYFHYLEAFQSYKHARDIYHIEEAYMPIFAFSPSYSLFRFIIWGTAFALLYYSREVLNIEKSVFLFAFVYLYLFRFSYARVSLSIAMIMFGYALIISKTKLRLWVVLLGLAIMFLSIRFHKSAILAIVGVAIGIVLTKKQYINLILLFLPLAIFFVNDYLYGFIIDKSLIEDELTLNAFNLYTQNVGSSTGRIGLGEIVFYTLETTAVYYMLYILYKFIYVKKIKTSRTIRLLFSATLGMVFLATSFAFTTPIIYKRILIMSMAPMVFSLSSIYDKIKNMTATKIGITLFILYQIYNILYNFRVVGAL